MKSLLSICRFFSLCFLVYAFTSCTKYLLINNVQVPKKVTIHITGYDTGTGNLTMVDDSGHSAVTFQAWYGQTIKWKIKGSGVHAIDSMPEKIINKNEIFQDKPHEIFLSKSWEGTIYDVSTITLNGIKDSLGYYDYDYKIVWEKNGIQHTFDPRIQIR